MNLLSKQAKKPASVSMAESTITRCDTDVGDLVVMIRDVDENVRKRWPGSKRTGEPNLRTRYGIEKNAAGKAQAIKLLDTLVQEAELALQTYLADPYHGSDFLRVEKKVERARRNRHQAFVYLETW